MDTLLTLRAFRRVVEATSFSRAAASLGITPGSASKLVAQLEHQLGARLLQRSTRKMSLTEAGRIYYDYCVRVLDELDDAERAVQQLLDAPRGTLRVSVPSSFGILWLSPHLPEFLRLHPEIRLDVVTNDRFVDLYEEGFDLALRITRDLPDSTLVARRLGEIARVVVASPDYLKHAGTPRVPSDLSRHNCLLYSLSEVAGEWQFEREGMGDVVNVRGNYQCNSSAMLRAALVQGVGVTQIPRLMVEDLLQSGELVSCLDDYSPPPHTLFAMLPEQRAVSPKVRAFIAFVAGKRGVEMDDAAVIAVSPM